MAMATRSKQPVNNGVNVEASDRRPRGAHRSARRPRNSSGARRANGKTAPTVIPPSKASSGWARNSTARPTFKFDADHPEVFASEDKGATPVEYVLVGLASCLTAGVAAIAQHRNIQLRKVTATIEGNMDLQGILGIDSDVRNGFGGIKVSYKIDADAKREDIEALVAQSQKRSAVYDIVTNPTNVTVEVL